MPAAGFSFPAGPSAFRAGSLRGRGEDGRCRRLSSAGAARSTRSVPVTAVAVLVVVIQARATSRATSFEDRFTGGPSTDGTGRGLLRGPKGLSFLRTAADLTAATGLRNRGAPQNKAVFRSLFSDFRCTRDWPRFSGVLPVCVLSPGHFLRGVSRFFSHRFVRSV